MIARTVSVLAVLALCGCAVSRDYVPPAAAELPVGNAFAAPLPPSAGSGPDADWWTRFDDPTLTDLVATATDDNLDLAVAAARLEQAREALVQARTGRTPTIGGSAGVTRSGFLTGAPSADVPIFVPGGGVGTQTISAGSQTNFQLGLDAAYTVDLFGAIGRGIEAADADLAAGALDAAAVRVSVAGETARNYIAGRTAQERLQIARDSLAIARENEEIAGFRVLAGLVSGVDEEQARTQRAGRLAAIPPLQQQVAQAANRLGVLTAQPPAATADVFQPPAPIPEPPGGFAVGVPADTLRQRPDVRAAERRLAAATARVGVAQAQLYPAFRISGNINNQALGLGGLFDTITYALFGGLTQTIFDGGRLRSQVRAQEAAVEVALAQYKQTILAALEDTENALRALNAAEARVAALREALDAAQATAIYARSQYRAGLTDFTTLLTVENQLLSAEDGLALARGDRAQAGVQLFTALGGGFGSGAGGGLPGVVGTIPTGAGTLPPGAPQVTPSGTVPQVGLGRSPTTPTTGSNQ